jgi:hypothetical protein
MRLAIMGFSGVSGALSHFPIALQGDIRVLQLKERVSFI